MGKNGKPACVSVEAAEGSAGSAYKTLPLRTSKLEHELTDWTPRNGVDRASDQACVSIDCFSMNQPFAGLVRALPRPHVFGSETLGKNDVVAVFTDAAALGSALAV
eukprot:3924386-Rhodomonas_salina.1